MMTPVPGGNNRGSVTLYALSTCPWCKKTKRLLQEYNVPYEYEDVDLLTGAEEEKAIAEIERLNPMRSFPTCIINGKVIAGFQESKIKEALGLS